MEKKPKKTNKTVLIIGGGLLAAGVIAAIASGSGNAPIITNPEPGTDAGNGSGSGTAPTINRNLVLKRGSKGLEVRELQNLLQVKVDGDFGPITETALYSVRSVTQISINQFNATPVKIPPVPQTPFRVGQNLMSSLRSGTRQYAVSQDAAGKWYIQSNNHESVADFGSDLGKVVAVLSASNQYFYVVVKSGLFSNSYKAVRHTEAKSY